MERKKITLSLKAWERAQRAREKDGIGWDQFVLRAIGASREVSLGKELRGIWDRLKRTERYQRSLDGELEVSLFFLKPEIKRLLFEAGRRQRRSPSELLENWITEKFGAGECSEEAETPPEAPIEASKKVEAPTEAPKKAKKNIIPKVNGRSLDLKAVSEDREKDPELSTAEKRWLRERAEWLEEAQRWEWKPSITLIWPEGAKARILIEEEAIQGEAIRKVRGLFIYHLKQREDLGFNEPYRLDFSIEKESQSELTRIEPGAHRTISFRIESYSKMNAKLKEKATVFEELEKGEIGDQIG